MHKKIFFQKLTIKSLLSFFCFCTFSLLTLGYLYAEDQTAEQTEEIIVGGNFDYPPYEFINNNGIPTGYSTELTYALAEVIGVKARVELDSWKTTRDKLENGKIDVIHGMYYSKERDKLVDFSPPHTIIYNTIFTRQNSPDIKSLNALKGKHIVVVERGVLHDFLKENNVTNKIILTDSDGAALRLVASGKYEYALLGKLPGIYLSKKLKLTNIKPTGPPILPFKYCFAVKEGNFSLLSRLNEGLAILKQTGRYQNIYDKWLGVYEPKLGLQKPAVKYFLIFFSTLLIFIAVGALWLKTLKKQVSERTYELSREIGERKLAEEALLESEERLKAVLEGSQLGYWDWNIKTNEVKRNERWGTMLGYTLEEVEFNVQQWTDLHHPDDCDAAWKSIQDHLKGLTSEHKIEYRMRTKDGQYKWILDQAKIIVYDSDGKPLRMSGTHTDITERKKTESTLKESESRYRALFDFNPIQTIVVDNDGKIIMCNFARERLSERMPAAGDLMYKDYAAKHETDMHNELMECIQHRKQKVFEELRYKHKYLKIQMTPFTHGAIITSEDITKNKNAEKSLQKKTIELIERNKELSALYSISKILDPHNRDQKKIFSEIVNLIPQTWQFPDQTSARIVFDKDEYVTNRFKESKWRQFSDILLSGKRSGTIEVFYSGEKAIDMKNPFFREEQILLDEIALRISGFLEQQAVEKQLLQSQKMESIGTLAGGIAHDFNNILSSILGFSDLALGQVEKGSGIEDDLKEIHAAGIRAKDLIRQILTFARKSEDIIKPISVHLIAKEASKLIRSSIPSTIEIIENIESRKQVAGSPTQFHQIFMNLFTNAAHAMEEKGGTLKIDLVDINLKSSILQSGELIKSGNYTKIEVADTGTGISHNIIKFIFEPYFTTKSVGEGTGMGLAVVHGIIENCGGKIVVESDLGKGTKFTIYLPCIEDAIEEEMTTEIALPKGHERILFVDDELQIVKIGHRILSKLGYEVDTCTNSIDALELFKKTPEAYDIIISDMTMPKITGYQLAEQMLETKPDTKFILCTGYSKKLNEKDIKQRGIKALLIKPVDSFEMATTIRKILDG